MGYFKLIKIGKKEYQDLDVYDSFDDTKIVVRCVNRNIRFHDNLLKDLQKLYGKDVEAMGEDKFYVPIVVINHDDEELKSMGDTLNKRGN